MVGIEEAEGLFFFSSFSLLGVWIIKYYLQVTMFSVYCERKFEVEPVKVTYPDGKSFVYPDLSIYNMNVPLSYITGIIGVQLPENEVL